MNTQIKQLANIKHSTFKQMIIQQLLAQNAQASFSFVPTNTKAQNHTAMYQFSPNSRPHSVFIFYWSVHRRLHL